MQTTLTVRLSDTETQGLDALCQHTGKSRSEVVREALRLLREQEDLKLLRTQELRRQLQVGVEQLDRGASRSFDESVTAEVKKVGRKRRAAR